jgi:hypothetical protein
MMTETNQMVKRINLGMALLSIRRNLSKSLTQKLANISSAQSTQKENTGNIQEGHWVKANPSKRMSMLLHPTDRERFIAWGIRKKHKPKQLTEAKRGQFGRILDTLKPQMAEAAQKVYADWTPDDEEGDDFGGGGICDAIAEAMAGVIASNIDCEIDEGGQEGDDHAFLLVRLAHERYWVDIDPGIYEQGGGYSWHKLEDIIIKPEDIIIEPV